MRTILTSLCFTFDVPFFVLTVHYVVFVFVPMAHCQFVFVFQVMFPNCSVNNKKSISHTVLKHTVHVNILCPVMNSSNFHKNRIFLNSFLTLFSCIKLEHGPMQLNDDVLY